MTRSLGARANQSRRKMAGFGLPTPALSALSASSSGISIIGAPHASLVGIASIGSRSASPTCANQQQRRRRRWRRRRLASAPLMPTTNDSRAPTLEISIGGRHSFAPAEHDSARFARPPTFGRRSPMNIEHRTANRTADSDSPKAVLFRDYLLAAATAQKTARCRASGRQEIRKRHRAPVDIDAKAARGRPYGWPLPWLVSDSKRPRLLLLLAPAQKL